MAEMLSEQDQTIQAQKQQIHALKQAVLRLERKVSKVATLAERANGENRRLNERLRVTESKLIS